MGYLSRRSILRDLGYKSYSIEGRPYNCPSITADFSPPFCNLIDEMRNWFRGMVS
jgi:hypothetical protein